MFPRKGAPHSIVLVAAVLGFCAVSVAAFIAYNHSAARQQFTQDWLEGLEEESGRAADALNSELRRSSRHADAIAEQLSSTKLSVDEIEDRLSQTFQQNPYIYGLGVGFRPYAYDPERRLLSRYLVKRDGGSEMTAIEDTYDYTDEVSGHWYHTALEDPGWQNPAPGDVSDAIIVLYCTPFQLPDEQRLLQAQSPDGLVCVSVSIEDFWDTVAGLALGRTSFPQVITSDGQYVTHPQRQYVREGRTIYDVAEELDDPTLKELGDRATAQQSGFMRHVDAANGQESWIYYTPIPEAEWALAVAAFDDESPMNQLDRRRRYIGLITAVVIAIICFIVLAAAWREFSSVALWVGSAAAGLIFAAGIGGIWLLSFDDSGDTSSDDIILINRNGMESYLDEYQEHVEMRRMQQSMRVPTGLIIESVDVIGPHDFLITGFIWHRYSVPEHDELERGILFPDAKPTRDILRETFRYGDETSETVGWFFKTTIHDPSDPSRFPLESRTLHLRIWHAAVEHNVVLVPDLEAYRTIHPAARAGMEADFRMPGWQVLRTFFGYSFHDYRVAFGAPDVPRRGDFPELTYQIGIHRRLAGAFISNQVPMLVATFLLFTILMLETRRKEKEAMGFSTSKVLAVAAAIFFTLLLAHIDMRRRYAANELMYAEYLYFITYLAIVAVSINAFLLAAKKKLRIIHYRDNVVPKLLFWPLLLGSYFAVTVWIFY